MQPLRALKNTSIVLIHWNTFQRNLSQNTNIISWTASVFLGQSEILWISLSWLYIESESDSMYNHDNDIHNISNHVSLYIWWESSCIYLVLYIIHSGTEPSVYAVLWWYNLWHGSRESDEPDLEIPDLNTYLLNDNNKCIIPQSVFCYDISELKR